MDFVRLCAVWLGLLVGLAGCVADGTLYQQVSAHEPGSGTGDHPARPGHQR